MHTEVARRFGDLDREVVRRRAQHRVAAFHRSAQRRGVVDVELQGGQARRALGVVRDLGELRRRAVGDGDAVAIVFGRVDQQVGDHRADLAAADDQDVLHDGPRPE